MSKITTVIDIGSNSMRMVVLEKSSRFAFSLINETKSRVKISEGCYENGGNLQEIPMERAYQSLKSFLNISNALKSRKVLCVATSALRDAPNSKVFLNRVKNDLGLSIKVIDGEKESYFGGVATSNLLHDDEFITIDIGGGSTEFCFVKDKKILKSISLNIGTVRIKELYFNTTLIFFINYNFVLQFPILVLQHHTLLVECHNNKRNIFLLLYIHLTNRPTCLMFLHNPNPL